MFSINVNINKTSNSASNSNSNSIVIVTLLLLLIIIIIIAKVIIAAILLTAHDGLGQVGADAGVHATWAGPTRERRNNIM